MTDIYVIFWWYSDKSGSGIVRSFMYEEDAKTMLSILKEQDSPRKYQIVKTTLVGRAP